MAERLTLGVLMAGVASLALSDFVSPVYWMVVAVLAVARLMRGHAFSLTEMQASMVGWIGFFWVALELVLGRPWVVAFTDFMLILAAAVVIEAATPRNHLHRMLVSLFLILAAAVLTDSVLYILPLLAFMWLFWRAAACLYGMGQSGGSLSLGLWKNDVRPMTMMVVVTVLLFFLLPRFAFHSVLQPTQPRMSTTGFSDQVQLGDFARELDATVVLRVEPLEEGIQQARNKMIGRYWRGLSLSRYTGTGWQKLQEKQLHRWEAGSPVTLSHQAGDDLDVAVYREASDHAYILLPNGVQGISSATGTILLGDQGGLRFKQPPTRRLRMVMQMGDRQQRMEDWRSPVAAEKDLDMPQKIRQWAMNVGGDSGSSKQRLERVAIELKSWTYDLEANIDGDHPIQSFLTLKRGHCELYATTLALAARAHGVPSRVVNGYFGGEWNDIGDFLLIRQQHAHSWVEVWLDDAWQRMDPTPSSRWQLSAIRFPQFDSFWESVKLAWYRYVLEFQDSDRGQLLMWILAWLKLYGWMLIVGGMTCAILLQVMRHRDLQRHHAAVRWPVLDRWLEMHGISRQPYESLRWVDQPEGISFERWRVFVLAWERQAYGSEKRWSYWHLYRQLRALSTSRC